MPTREKFRENIIVMGFGEREEQAVLKPDPGKVKVVEEMPQPKCKQEVLILLGSIN